MHLFDGYIQARDSAVVGLSARQSGLTRQANPVTQNLSAGGHGFADSYEWADFSS